MLNKDPYIVQEASLLNILDSKSALCMAKSGKDTNRKSVKRKPYK